MTKNIETLPLTVHWLVISKMFVSETFFCRGMYSEFFGMHKVKYCRAFFGCGLCFISDFVVLNRNDFLTSDLRQIICLRYKESWMNLKELW